MSISLYQLTDKFLEAAENLTVDEESGELIGFEAVEALEGEFEKKTVECALYFLELNAGIAAVKAEEEKLKANREALTKKRDRFKEYIANCMQSAGKDKISDPRVQLSFRSSKQVVVDNMDELPEEFVNVKITKTPDKAAIRKAIENKTYLVGARLVRNRNLQIK